MHVRIIDYVGNLGGGVRFAVEMLRAMVELQPTFSFELISHGDAYQRYFEILGGLYSNLSIRDVSPQSSWRNKRSLAKFPFPGRKLAKRLLGGITKWHFEIPGNLFDDCDILWFPWIHWHRIPGNKAAKVIGSYHDSILLQFQIGLLQARVENERRTVRNWLDTNAIIVVSSQTTTSTLKELFGVETNRFKVIPLSGEHRLAPQNVELSTVWKWTQNNYLIYAANTSPHKNHELLFDAFKLWGEVHPLVLTGDGTDLKETTRGEILRKYAEDLMIDIDKTLIPLGYVSSEIYDSLIERAWAVVMCSLAEGGGSFPVWEAMLRGIPVVCADIPIMREHLQRTGGEVIWFDPNDKYDLASKLEYLNANYAAMKVRAERQRGHLVQRSWKDVANEYLSIINERRENRHREQS